MKSETEGQERSMRIEIVNGLGTEIVDVIEMIVIVENATIVVEAETGMTVFVIAVVIAIVSAIVNVTETVKEGVIATAIAIVMTDDVSATSIDHTGTSTVKGMLLGMVREEEVGLNHSNRNLTQPS